MTPAAWRVYTLCMYYIYIYVHSTTVNWSVYTYIYILMFVWTAVTWIRHKIITHARACTPPIDITEMPRTVVLSGGNNDDYDDGAMRTTGPTELMMTLPRGRVVTSVTLRIYISGVPYYRGGSGPNRYSLHRRRRRRLRLLLAAATIRGGMAPSSPPVYWEIATCSFQRCNTNFLV